MPRRKIARAALTIGFFASAASLVSFAANQAVPGQTQTPAAVPNAAPVIPGLQTGPNTPPPPPPPTTIILDPAHGGPDSGAHAEAEEGAVEKDLVLTIAQAMRRELEKQGVRVVLTRQGDAAVSIDDRAAQANGLPSGFFVSLHVGSTGDPNTAQAYSFGTPLGGAPPAYVPRPLGVDLIRWDDAQQAYAVPSRRFAELLQVELAQKLRGSPDVPQFAEIRQLRVVAHPAVAIELSSVGEENAAGLEKAAAPLANALVKALAAYRQAQEARP